MSEPLHRALQHRWLNDAVVSPFRRPVHPDFAGGLHPPEGPAPAFLRHHRSRRPVDQALPAGNDPKRLKGAFLYGGPLILEFGHFLAESVARLLPGLRLEPELPVLFAGPRGTDHHDALRPSYVQQVLAFLGVPLQRVHVVQQPVQVDRLLVVEQGSDLGGGPKPAYLDMLDDFSPGRLDALSRGPGAERVYVSRSRMPAGRLLGERYLEALLAEAGFLVYRPEDHTLVEQMNTYRSARQLVFPEGSACHGTELLGRQLQQVILLNRRPAPKPAMFRAILRPRARRYAELASNPFVGALPIGMARPPLLHRGVAVFDVPALLDLLEAEGVARLHDCFDHQAHADCVRADFEEHLAWALEHPRTDARDVRAAAPQLARTLDQLLSGPR